MDSGTYLLTKRCNNNCIFCARAFTEEKNKDSFEQIKKDLLEKKKQGFDSIIFTGGEPAIHKDFLKVLEFSKALGFEKVSVQTNGRIFSNISFCEKVVDILGDKLDIFLSFHTIDKQVYKELARTDGFEQTINGIKNLVQLGVNVRTNTVVMKPNYEDLEGIIEFISNLGVESKELMWIHPRGRALNNLEKIVPDIREVTPYLIKAIKKGEQLKGKITLESFPFCATGGYEDYCSENLMGEQMSNSHKIMKHFGEDCKECDYYKKCPGIWKRYFDIYGFDFRPIDKTNVDNKQI